MLSFDQTFFVKNPLYFTFCITFSCTMYFFQGHYIDSGFTWTTWLTFYFNLLFLFLKKILVLVLQIWGTLRYTLKLKFVLKVFKAKISPFLFPYSFLPGKQCIFWLLLKPLYSIKDSNIFNISAFKGFLRVSSSSLHDSCFSVLYFQWIL